MRPRRNLLTPRPGSPRAVVFSGDSRCLPPTFPIAPQELPVPSEQHSCAGD